LIVAGTGSTSAEIAAASRTPVRFVPSKWPASKRSGFDEPVVAIVVTNVCVVPTTTFGVKLISSVNGAMPPTAPPAAVGW
jgi:hypothetical protein